LKEKRNPKIYIDCTRLIELLIEKLYISQMHDGRKKSEYYVLLFLVNILARK